MPQIFGLGVGIIVQKGCVDPIGIVCPPAQWAHTRMKRSWWPNNSLSSFILCNHTLSSLRHNCWYWYSNKLFSRRWQFLRVIFRTKLRLTNRRCTTSFCLLAHSTFRLAWNIQNFRQIEKSWCQIGPETNCSIWHYNFQIVWKIDCRLSGTEKPSL